MDTWIVSQISNFWQLWIVPLQRVTYKYLFPILLGRYLGMERLDHVIILGFFTEKYQIIFYNGCTILYSEQQCLRIMQLLYNRIIQQLFQLSCIFTNTCYFPLFYILAILVSVKSYHMVALTCISLMTNGVEHLSTCLVQFSSVAQSCRTVCNPMDCSTSGLPVYHQLLQFTQTHIH